MNFKEILFIGCVVLVATVCVLGFVGSFFRDGQQYEVVSMDSLKLPTSMVKESEMSPQMEFITLEKRTGEVEEGAEKPVVAPEAGKKNTDAVQKPAPDQPQAEPAAKSASVVKPEPQKTEQGAAQTPPSTGSSPRDSAKGSPAAAAPSSPSAAVKTESAPAKAKGTEKKSESAAEASAVKAKEPEKKTSAADEDEEKTIYYTVKPGETLSAICRSFGLKPESVAKDNNFKAGDPLVSGRKLMMFVSSRMLAPKKKVAGREYLLTYAVKNGETLAGIAAANRVSLPELQAANRGRIKNASAVEAGQEILIPVRER